MTTILESFCPEDTFAIGKKIGEKARAGQILCLDGDLGTGKTVFTQGVAAGLGVEEAVNSPTFTILQIYEEGRIPLYHFDVYRIADLEEMEEIGYEEYFYGEGICLIEWASLIGEQIPSSAIWITLEKELEKGFDYRRLTVMTQGANPFA